MLDPPLTSHKASGMELVEEHANDVIEWYAERGDVLGCEQFLQTFIKGAATYPHIRTSSRSITFPKVLSPTISAIYTSKRTKRAFPPALSLTMPSHFFILMKTLGDRRQ